MQIIYEPHPVSTERKAELRAKGLTIVDAIFKPTDTVVDVDEKQESTSDDDNKPMSKAELQAALDAKGIAHKPANSKAELQALLDSAQ